MKDIAKKLREQKQTLEVQIANKGKCETGIKCEGCLVNNSIHHCDMEDVYAEAIRIYEWKYGESALVELLL